MPWHKIVYISSVQSLRYVSSWGVWWSLCFCDFNVTFPGFSFYYIYSFMKFVPIICFSFDRPRRLGIIPNSFFQLYFPLHFPSHVLVWFFDQKILQRADVDMYCGCLVSFRIGVLFDILFKIFLACICTPIFQSY